MRYEMLMPATQAQKFSVFLQAILERLGWTLDEIEKRGGPSREVVGRHLRADEDTDRTPKTVLRSTRIKYAEAFQCDPDKFEKYWQKADHTMTTGSELQMADIINTIIANVQDPGGGLPSGSDYDPRAQPSLTRAGWIPAIGRIAAGKATDFEHELAGDKAFPPSLYNAPAEHPAALIAQGDSMAPLIDDGDVVIIARRFWRAPQSGDIVAVSKIQEGGHTIKHLEVLKDGRWMLQPHNTHKHRPETLEPGQVKAAAVVVGWYHAVHRPKSKS